MDGTSDRDAAKDEYEHACNNARHYSNIRFANLTAFLGLTIAVAALSFGIQFAASPPIWLQAMGRVAGLFVSVIFGVFEYRANKYIDHFQSRARELELVIGYRQWSTIPTVAFLHADIAVLSLYVLVAVFWWITLVELWC